ncbi:Fur family transcriptional regulator [Periweissella ghanensis]|uniref:Peroxide-responsive repressor PerR n=1 Tax=Periweissella ghanensis TaxID=467997 RepID=A0ABN8BKF2_9LACO|nr:Fur family transcriptional regulator [Periweissella ghanensis]MCM0601748.1 transcriptional repressor [Periweissella ghanensis]CAH0418180.1 Peroxide-responsive repressor PerR [Periweissella ghanensis]
MKEGLVLTTHELENALDFLRQKGLRITRQRSLILNYLITQHNHPTAEEIFNTLKAADANLSLATVYNTLDLFIEHHLVVNLASNDDKQHFDYFAHPHYHVICSVCGRIEDVFDFSFNPLLDHAQAHTDYQIDHAAVEVFGVCPTCQAKQKNSK